MKGLASIAATLLSALPVSFASRASPWGPPSGHEGNHRGPPGYVSSLPHHGPPSTSSQSCPILTSDDIRASGNNSLFTRWRPHSHVLAPAGWMNDPCAPMYDPTRDEYHIFYQWHPNHINWGNISWGYATSKDLVTWIDHDGWKDDKAAALAPTGNGSYNGLGIFSGTGQPVNINGTVDGTLLIFYTSVAHLPTNWKIEYQPYTETQSLATSTDGGKTWHEYENNPVIDATTETAPMHWNITGFRDPFFEPLPDLDLLLGVSEPHYYAVFGSGIKGVGPRMPLWTAPARDLTDWSFLGALWEPKDNTTLGPVLSTGTYGFNFEVSGFFPLPDRNGDLHYFVNMGTEGGNVSFHQSAQWALWNEGTVSKRENGSVEFTPVAGGAGDWGCAYALSSFNDTKNNRRVQWGWAKEDIVGDGALFSASQQGFSGALTLPRELFVHEVDNVIDHGNVAENKNAVLTESDNNICTARTLGIKPLTDVVEGLHTGAVYTTYSSHTYNSSAILETQASAHLHLKAIVASHTGAVGLTIDASPDGTEYTNIIYEPSNNTVLVDRLHSSTIVDFNNATVTGYFYPYTLSSNNEITEESLRFDVFIDGSLVEIYVNDRFALTTRIYTSMECSTGYGVYVPEGESATFEGVEAWVGTLNAWPERPLNSSSALVWDSPEETNDYLWWSGN